MVRHHSVDAVLAASAGAGLPVERVESFGQRWAPKWQLWFAVKR